MDCKLLSQDELARIKSFKGRKLEINAEAIVKQLLAHIEALTPKVKVEKPVNGNSK